MAAVPEALRAPVTTQTNFGVRSWNGASLPRRHATPSPPRLEAAPTAAAKAAGSSAAAATTFLSVVADRLGEAHLQQRGPQGRPPVDPFTNAPLENLYAIPNWQLRRDVMESARAHTLIT